MAVLGTLKHAWNAFLNQSPFDGRRSFGVGSYSSRPDRTRLGLSNERSLVASIYTRLSIDVSSVDMRHVRLDDNKRYSEDMISGLNDCLTVEANIDQAATAFMQDVALTLFEVGVAAIVPVDADMDPTTTGGYDIGSLRVGTVTQWFPEHVRVLVYNEKNSRKEEIVLPKKMVAIIENPLYQVMNEPNSTLQRIIRKLNMLDSIDEQTSSGKLDMVIQLPYAIKSDTRRQQAAQRRTDIELQLKGSKYGIAYIDGTEKITQLNRPAENNLLSQIEYLFKTLYGQLGLDETIMNGTADESAMLNYFSRTVEPILKAIVEEMRRKFLTKTARSQKQSILYFRDAFKLVPIKDLAEMADKFTRNEILTSNEFRGIIGFKPSKDTKADQLVNSNLYTPDQQSGAAQTDATATDPTATDTSGGSDDLLNSTLDSIESSVDDMLSSVGG